MVYAQREESKGRGFFITATDTDVGKTLVTGGIVGALRRRGCDMGVYKPLQSGHLASQPEGDAARLKRISGVADSEEEICPYSFKEAVAPRLAMQRAGETVRLDDVLRGYEKLRQKHAFLAVEGAGGLAVPYTADALVADVVAALGLPLLVVARPVLGTVNHTLLTIAYARTRGLFVAGVILSGCGRHPHVDVAEAHNAAMIEELGRVPILGCIPWLGEHPDEKQAVQAVERHVNLTALYQWMIKGEMNHDASRSDENRLEVPRPTGE